LNPPQLIAKAGAQRRARPLTPPGAQAASGQPRNGLALAPRFGSVTRALVVDSHLTTRNILAAHLRVLGLGQVVQCARAQEALREIDTCGFDVLLCEYRLADGTLGKDLIEDLRRSARLSLRTVVMVIAAEAVYDTVAEVAESAVDGFVIRPYSPGGLEDRLLAAYRRKEALSPVFDAVEAGRHAQALQLCEHLYARRAPHWTHAARLGAELALRLDRPTQASQFFEAVMAVKAVPWAKLGIARTLAARGAADQALSTLENLLAAEPRYADAYDVLGKLHAEEGNLPAAMKAFEQASRITPASVQRAQKFGILAYYAGEPQLAQAALQRAAQLGSSSRQFDPQTLLLLALLHHRGGEADSLQACQAQLEAAQARHSGLAGPEGLRLQRFGLIVQALGCALRSEPEPAAALASQLASQVEQPDFDIEAATNLLSLLGALRSTGLPLAEGEAWVRGLGLRFCISRHATEMLAQAAQAHRPYQLGLRQAHAEIGVLAQAALGQVLAGEPQAAVEQLLAHTEATRNAKLLHSAAATLARYRGQIADAALLQARCQALQAQWAPGTATAGAAPAEEAPPPA
jgi:DNA-binding response OmpR family regulator